MAFELKNSTPLTPLDDDCVVFGATSESALAPGTMTLPAIKSYVIAGSGSTSLSTRDAVTTTTISSAQTSISTEGYSSIGDFGGGLYLRVDSEPSHPGKVQSDDGAWWELSETKPRLEQFGAVADGTTDSGAAIQDAVDYTAAKGAGTIWGSHGTYIVGQTITLPSHVTLRGAGIDATIFKAKDSLNADMFTTTDTDTLFSGDTAGGAKYWGICDASIDGNKANQTSGNGIKTYSRSYLLQNLKIMNCKNIGLQTKWGAATAAWDDDEGDDFMAALIDRVLVGSCGDEGIDYNGPHDSFMRSVVCAENSQTVAGSKAGIHIGTSAGGLRSENVHSWGVEQKYAFHCKASSAMFTACTADEAATALVLVEGDDFSWIGGSIIGGWIDSPPSTANKNLTGFVLGSSSKTIWRPHIVTSASNIPNGVVDFTYVDGSADNRGVIRIIGGLLYDLQTVNTGQDTYGFLGSVPTTMDIYIAVAGTGNASAVCAAPNGLCISTTNTDPAWNNVPGFCLRSDGRMSVRGADNFTAGSFGRSNSGTVLEFLNAGSIAGSISVGSGSTAYNTSSDYRLKDNVENLTNALETVRKLRPVSFVFKTEPNETVTGFIAHEVQAVVPYAVHGDKDAVDAKGVIVPQGIDPSKLIGILCAAVLELDAQIQALQTPH